jgi:hypothetical protein
VDRNSPPVILQFTTKGIIVRDLQSERQDLYRQAISETSPLDLAGQIAVAEEAVFLGMEELRASSDGQVERQGIEDAIRLLSVLKNEMLRSTIAIENEQRLWLGDLNSR